MALMPFWRHLLFRSKLKVLAKYKQDFMITNDQDATTCWIEMLNADNWKSSF